MGDLQEKVQEAYRTLRLSAEMSEHYYGKPIIVCYSGGKDSDVLLNLALECLEPNQFEVMHSITTVDSWITNKHVNDVFKELEANGIRTIKNIPRDRDGNPTNMWKLIEKKQIPPTRLARYCCEILKETSTPNRIVALGVREDESTNRKNRNTFSTKPAKISDQKFFSLDHAEEVFREALKHEEEENGSVWDCTMISTMKNQKDMLSNPIYGWSDSNVWDYIRTRGIKYNPQYDMGYSRCGCVGCPLATYKMRKKEFTDFPYMKELYIKAFDKMLERRRESGKDDVSGKDGYHVWKTGQDVFDWWIEERKRNIKGQVTIDEWLKETM